MEDFAYERADPPAVTWAAGEEARLRAAGMLADDEDPLFGADPMASWLAHHREKHSVSGGREVVAALAARLHLERLESVPYLYRYFAGRLRGSDAPAAGCRLLAEEARLIANRSIPAIGLRVVARRVG